MEPTRDLYDRPLFTGPPWQILLAAAGVLAPLYIAQAIGLRTDEESVGLIGVIVSWLLAGAVLRIAGVRWSEVGLRRAWRGRGLRTALWASPILLVLSAGAGWLLETFTGWTPDLSDFEVLRGNPSALLGGLLIVWSTAAFGEEMIFRAFLLHALRDASGRRAWVLPVLLGIVLFGAAHAYQGLAGMVLTGFIGLLLSLLYLATGRNLWAVILTHGIYDTLGFVIMYLGWESVREWPGTR